MNNGNYMPGIAPDDRGKGNVGWAVLSFFIPLVGLILFLVWREDRPEDSRYAGLGALIAVIVRIVFTILMFVFAFYITTSIVEDIPTDHSCDIYGETFERRIIKGQNGCYDTRTGEFIVPEGFDYDGSEYDFDDSDSLNETSFFD